METILASEPDQSPSVRQHGRLNELVDRATELFGRDDYGGARDALLEALELNAEQVDLVLFLGNVYYQMRDLAAARTQFERAVELDPGRVGARISLAGLLAETEQFEAAEVSIRAALGFESDNPRALKFLAGLLLRNGRVAEANETFAAMLAGVLTARLETGSASRLEDGPLGPGADESMPIIDAEGMYAVSADPERDGGADLGEPAVCEGVGRLEVLIEEARGLSSEDKAEALGQVALLTQLELGEVPPSVARVEMAFEALLGTFAGIADDANGVNAFRSVEQFAETFRETIALRPDLIPIPPPSIRSRGTSGSISVEQFLASGKVGQQLVRSALELAGTSWENVTTVLDFGCGCGRVLRTWGDVAEGKDIYGTDVDVRTIDWCERNVPVGSCTANDVLPPLRYFSQMFDLIYSFSGFPKPDEKSVFHWLGELKRIVKPGGVLVLAVRSGTDPVRDLAARFFTVAGEVPGHEGMDGLLVMRKA